MSAIFFFFWEPGEERRELNQKEKFCLPLYFALDCLEGVKSSTFSERQLCGGA